MIDVDYKVSNKEDFLNKNIVLVGKEESGMG